VLRPNRLGTPRAIERIERNREKGDSAIVALCPRRGSKTGRRSRSPMKLVEHVHGVPGLEDQSGAFLAVVSWHRGIRAPLWAAHSTACSMVRTIPYELRLLPHHVDSGRFGIHAPRNWSTTHRGRRCHGCLCSLSVGGRKVVCAWPLASVGGRWCARGR
jgi:hypothetical protein